MVGYGLELGSPVEKQIAQIAREYPAALRLSTENGVRERANLLSNARVAIFAATNDHLPQSLLEAMAAGTPTICTSIEGYAPIAEDRTTSLLIDTKLAGLAEAVMEITTNLSLCFELTGTAQRLIKSRYSETAAGPVLSELVAQLPRMKDTQA